MKSGKISNCNESGWRESMKKKWEEGEVGIGDSWGRGKRDRQMDRHTEGIPGVTSRLAG